MVPAKTWIEDATRDLPALLLVGEAGAALRAHPRTIRRMIAAGRLQAVRSREGGSSRVLVPRDSIRRYLETLSVGAL
jgi:excisionase family DNA binding protein